MLRVLLHAELDKLKVEQQAEMARLTHSVDFYSERLGLTLQNAGGSLSLDFTLIDPASPQKVSVRPLHIPSCLALHFSREPDRTCGLAGGMHSETAETAEPAG
eukprot:SAG31_NODE_4605_length_3098_cov_20.002001_5_plen_103_part_00